MAALTRDDQAKAVGDALAQWLAAAKSFDAAHAADVAALKESNEAFTAYNLVAYKLIEHTGATEEEQIDALQKKIAYNAALKRYNDAFAVTAAASKGRNDARAILRPAVDALDTNPGEIENTGGTIIGGATS